ncbi:MAG: MliC family protein [Methylococcales bacterium]|nr:MliC family protein [Methylococcales bacterium]
MHRLLVILSLLPWLSACSMGGTPNDPLELDATPVTTPVIEGADWQSRTVVYRCQPDDTELQVAYLVLDSGESFAALSYRGLLSLMQNRPAASGTRYIALDEQKSLRWHGKGNTGRLTFRPADDMADERLLLRECRAKNP